MNNIQVYLLIAHVFGDYVFQSHWMANNKQKQAWPCVVHCLFYTACFVPFYFYGSVSGMALWLIFITHYLIDRNDLAKYVCYAKNFISPGFKYHKWKDCDVTGYQDKEMVFLDRVAVTIAPEVPRWLSTKLKIMADNAMHIAINAFAVAYFAVPSPMIVIDLSTTDAKKAVEAVGRAQSILTAVKMVNDFEKLIKPIK